MQIPLYTVFENQIKTLTGFDFQNFIVKLFLNRYGHDGFTPIRRNKDKGNDGIIINDKTVIACYGSQSYVERDVVAKMKADYHSYAENWKSIYPNWKFIVNHKITPKEIETAETLHRGSSPMGIEQIMQIICSELNGYKKRTLAKDLNIDENQYFKQEYLSEILEDLLNGTQIDISHIPKYKAINPEEKIKINYPASDVDAAMEEFSTVVVEFPKIDSLIKAYSSDEQERIKLRIQNDYKNASGDFKTRMTTLIQNYLSQFANLNDDDYRYYVIAVLLYHFEQCIIGKKTKNELSI